MRSYKHSSISLKATILVMMILAGCSQKPTPRQGTPKPGKSVLDINLLLTPGNERSFGIKIPFKLKGDEYLFDFSLERKDGAISGNLNISGQIYEDSDQGHSEETTHAN